ncbi:MAG: BamA/TamA family outer membrane protein [Sphingobacteriales bacterium]|nr:BamA/TamA family outer membrane protein [Sphingobacteriales bacterium]
MFLFISWQAYAQTDSIARRIVLIGDAGQLTDGRHPVVNAVKNLIPLDNKTTVLFLGDNVYRNGLPDSTSSTYSKYRAILDSQLSVADNTPARVVMIPGNHDWENGSRSGYDAIVRQQLYVSLVLNKPNVKYRPEDGCPGPDTIQVGNDVLIILFDSQWWLHPYDKPEIESDCKCKTPDELATQIGDIVAKNSKKLIIIACHHPFKSYGPHGGYYTLKQHLFPFTDLKKSLYIPLPVLGSIYPLARSVFGSPQDLKYPAYTNMIEQIGAVVKGITSNVIFVAGHEHNLEHIYEDGYNYIVSGGGCKINQVSKKKNVPFTSASIGFSVMEISKNKNVTIDFYTVLDTVRKVHSATLLNYTPVRLTDTITAEVMAAANLPDSVSKAASKIFPQTHGLKKFFMGQNYRREWSTPVKIKTFDIDKEKGGFRVEGVGGGNQTRSLQLIDSKGKDWSLRQVEKLGISLPDPFKNYMAADMAKQLTSASHPYGALIIPGLARPLNLVVPAPELFVVEDDGRLQGYRNQFAGKVCMLEDRFTRYKGKETRSTSKMFKEMTDDNDHRPDQPTVLTARLLDMFTGDFDRHLDQWRWYKIDTGKGEVYYPIARDRDQAFFYSDGKLMKWMIGRMIPFLKGFRHDINDVDWLGYAAKDFDRVFLTDLDANEWKNAIDDFKEKLTDSVIRSAVKNLPAEIFAISGEEIIQKLVSRRNILSDKAMTYYEFISKKVNVVGSNQQEYFKISNYGDGLQVRVYERGRGNDTSFIMYDRVFNPSVTKEIRLYGLGDNDYFDIEENAKSRIKFRIIGGNGTDTFNIRGQVENLLYDRKADKDTILNKSKSKKRFTTNPHTSSRSLLSYNYNTSRFPQLTLGYNADDETLIGIGASKRTFGFRNLPYATDQRFSFLYSSRGAYHFNYKGEFNHITRNADLLIQSRLAQPSLRNFFGLGNNTTADKKNMDYYRIHSNEFEIEALIRHRYFERLHVSIGPYYYQYKSSYAENRTNILSNFRQMGMDSADIFSNKSNLGIKAICTFDNRNNEVFPTRGIFWNNELVSLAGLNKNSDAYTRFTSDMTIYASLKDPAKIVGVLRFGGGRIFGNKYDYFQALDLGANNYLHGFRKNRFSGSSNMYASLELRIKLFDVNSFIFSGPLGLTAFYDAGRVWLRHQDYNKWHSSFGGGLYFVPFNRFVISFAAGFSEQERVFNATIGSRFNLTF